MSAESMAIDESSRSGKIAGSPWNLRRIGVRRIAERCWIGLTQHDLLGRAAQLAYYFVFSLFPGLVAASALIGLVVSSGAAFSDRLLNYLGSVIPPSGFAIVSETFSQTTHASTGGKLLLGLAVALWSASSGTSAIQDALNAVHQVKEKRPYWKARLEAIGLTILVGVLSILALTILMSGDMVEAYLTGFLKLPMLFTILTRILAWPIAFAVAAVSFAVVYHVAPDVKQARWRWISPGAVIGIVIWLAASTGLRLYVHFFNSFSVTYGSLGAVIVLLTWFYLSGLSLLLGAEINVVIDEVIAEENKACRDAQSKVA
jgi:membrane protein